MEATVLLVTDSITLSGKVVAWAIETFKEKADRGNNLSVLTQADSLEWKSHFSSSSLDVVAFLSEKYEFHKQNWVVELATILKPGGVVFIQTLVSREDGITKIHTSLEHSLLLAGLVRPEVVAPVEGLGSSDGFELFALRAQKPTWETGSSFSLKNKAVQKQEHLPKSDQLGVKLEMNDDLEDLIDEESLLSEEDLKKPSLPSANDCEVSTKRKACKNCTCGRVELEEKQTKLGLTAEQLNNPQFACGNVFPPAVPFKKAADNTSPRLSKNPVFSNHQKLAGRRGSPNGIKPPFSSPGMPPSSRIPNKLLPVSNVCADTSFKGNGETGVKGFMPMPGGNEYTRPSFQRGVRSLHPQGGPNPYLSSYGHRPNNIHEQRRLNYDWNSQQALYGTDNTAMYQRVGPRNRPLPPLIPPNYGLANNPGFHAIPTLYFPPRTHLDSVRGGPYFVQPPPPGVFVSAPDPQLCASIVKQIDYYFSVVNLCKDPFLRMNMDGQGWVPISLIAGFNLIKALTSDINLILFALRSSSVVEVKADKIRRRGDWSKWVLPAGVIKSTSRTQPQDTCINVNTGNVENDAKLEGQTSVSSRHLIGSPLTENGVPSGVSSELERTSDHGISKRTFPEGDIINGILDIRINETV